MEEHNYGHPGNEGAPARGSVPRAYRPYWQRAHQDWRFILGMALVFAAIAFYVISNDLSLVPHSQPHQTLPGTIGQ